MTPLELLAVGVIVVLVWMCGMRVALRAQVETLRGALG